MLDDERRALAEIEDHLRMADPAFVARMDAPGSRPFPVLTILGVMLFVTAPLVSLLFGAAALGLATAVVLGVMAAVAVHRQRHHRRMGNRSSGSRP
jgi:hypothetical protein